MTFNEQSWLLNTIQYLLGTLGGAENWEQTGNVNVDDAAALGVECIYTFYPAVDMIATVLPFAGDVSNVPDGALLCDGSSYLRADYPDLFSIVRTIYGSVDGTHFNVPDLRGRTVVGVGSGSGLTPRALASIFGEEGHTLSSGEMPSHNHGLNTFDGLAVAPGELPVKIPMVLPTDATANTGGGGSHNNMQPSIALNYIIVAVHG